MKCGLCGSIYQNDNEGDINLCNLCLKIMEEINDKWLEELNIRIELLKSK